MTIEQRRHDHKTNISLQHFVIVTLCRTPKCKNSKSINSKNRHFITIRYQKEENKKVTANNNRVVSKSHQKSWLSTVSC